MSLSDNKAKIRTLLDGINALPNATGGASAKHAEQHYSPNILTWDGDETGRTVVVAEQDNNSTIKFVHVSDIVPTEEEIYSGLAYAITDTVSNQLSTFMNITEDNINFVEGVYIISDDILICTSEATLPKKGIYFIKDINLANPDEFFYVTYLYGSGITFTTATDPLNPIMIGAAPVVHMHFPEDIYAGTFRRRVSAGSEYPDMYLLRNSRLNNTALTPTTNGEICWVYE